VVWDRDEQPPGAEATGSDRADADDARRIPYRVPASDSGVRIGSGVQIGHRAEGLLQRWQAARVLFWNPDRRPEPAAAA